MSELSSKVACVVDHGLFPHIALCLAEKCKHVFYVGPGERVMPHLADGIIGDGFDKISRVTDLWRVKNETDFFVFPDIGFTGEQQELRSQGKSVWGHMGADVIESNRGLFLETLSDLGMEVPPYEIIQGLSRLREHLRDKEDLYIKISRWRGDWETFHWRNWTLDSTALDCAAYRLGPSKDLIKFYVFDSIPTDVEDGVDGYFINGWPKRILHAMERKDKSLLGAMQDHDNVMDEVWNVNEKFGTVLSGYGYRGAFSTEVRIDDQTSYFIDPTMRFGSPPSQLQTVLIKNLPEIIWHGANGELVEPESDDDFGGQVLITSDREKDEWLSFPMPEEIRPFVKAAFCCEIERVFTIAPNPLENWAGWLVATANSIAGVVDTLKDEKDMLPDGFDCDISSLCDLLRELESAKEFDVKITDQPVPEPSTVIEK